MNKIFKYKTKMNDRETKQKKQTWIVYDNKQFSDNFTINSLSYFFFVQCIMIYFHGGFGIFDQWMCVCVRAWNARFEILFWEPVFFALSLTKNVHERMNKIKTMGTASVFDENFIYFCFSVLHQYNVTG